jgi:hypothetical protein
MLDLSATWEQVKKSAPDRVIPDQRCDEFATRWARGMETLDKWGCLPYSLALLMEQIREPEVSL